MRKNTIEAQEARLAVWMLIPSLTIVLSIVLFPVLLNIWVSFKPVKLGDLRPPQPIVQERVNITEEGNLRVRYQIRNSNPNKPIESFTLNDNHPLNFKELVLTPLRFSQQISVDQGDIFLMLENIEGGYIDELELVFQVGDPNTANSSVSPALLAELEETLLNSLPHIRSTADNVFLNLNFTFDNYAEAISRREVARIMLTTILYALFGSTGALLLGLLAALLLSNPFPGRGFIRGIFLFPYVAPIVAVAFVWRFMLDPQSGTINQLLQVFNIIQEPISFLSTEPNALLSTIFFDAWRYFPFCYLFILARLQAIPKVLYESAEIEGAGPLTTFRKITLPQMREVLLSVFILRFIWTFNRFDDIFLLTGGASGTRTLPIQIYDFALGAGDIGAGSAASVILFILLSIFLAVFLTTSKEVDS